VTEANTIELVIVRKAVSYWKNVRNRRIIRTSTIKGRKMGQNLSRNITGGSHTCANDCGNLRGDPRLTNDRKSSCRVSKGRKWLGRVGNAWKVFGEVHP